MTAESTAETVTADTSTESATTETATQTTTEQSSEVTPPETTTPQVPETYEFTMPEGVELDTAAVEKFTPLFKEAGLTQEAASKLVAAYAEHMAELGGKGAEAFEAEYEKRFAADVQKRVEADAQALKDDPEIGGAKAAAVHKQVADFLGQNKTEAFDELHNRYGLGNNPEIVRLIHRAIHYTPIDTGEQPAGAGGGPETDMRKRWYPDLAK